jgi:hypothetical protein
VLLRALVTASSQNGGFGVPRRSFRPAASLAVLNLGLVIQDRV